MEISKKFANNIREIAKSKKMKIGEIEKNVGVAVGYLSRLDTSKTEMRIDIALKFCKAVGMSFEEVMNYEPKYEVEWINETLYITQGKKILGKVSKEQILEACKKVNKMDIPKRIDEMLGGQK